MGQKRGRSPTRVLLGLNITTKTLRTQAQLPAMVNGEWVNFLIDSGASVSTITEDVVTKCGLRDSIDFDSGNSDFGVVGWVRLNLRMKQDVTFRYDFAVFVRGRPCVLGLDFLEDFDACADFSRGVLDLSLTPLQSRERFRGKFMTQVEIFGKSHSGFVDTGLAAELKLHPSVVSPENEEKYQFMTRKVNVCTFDGAAQKDVKFLKGVEVKMLNTDDKLIWRPVFTSVMHPGRLNSGHQVALGLPFFTDHRATIHFRERWYKTESQKRRRLEVRERQHKRCRFC